MARIQQWLLAPRHKSAGTKNAEAEIADGAPKFAGETEEMMRAQVLRAYDEKLSNDLWVGEEKVPDPKLTKSTDVIVRIGGAGVCRTDLHIVEGVWKPHMDPSGDKLLPLIMGHENAGWIEEVGKEVEGLKKGDPVIVHPKISGGTRLDCRPGVTMHQAGKAAYTQLKPHTKRAARQ